MLQPGQTPHGYTFELWHGFATTTILAILAAARLFLNRKKPSAEIHESIARAGKTEAETRQIETESVKSFSEVMLAMTDKIAALHERQSQQQERHDSQVQFLQAQVETKSKAEHEALEREQIARDNSHKAIAEVQRCIFVIRDYEELMRAQNVSFTPFDFKAYEDIMKVKDD